MTYSLCLSELHFSYADTAILNGASLRVRQGEILGVLGASGCGKSTILKCILQLLAPTTGRIDYWTKTACCFPEDSESNESSTEQDLLMIRRSIGYLPQEATLYPFLNARDNVAFGLIHAQGVRQGKALAEADEALDALGLASFTSKFPWQMSGGQAQRVALARAIISAKSLLLLDEPTSAQDASSSIVIANFLQQYIAKRSIGTLVITHNFGFANLCCDSVTFLRDGNLSIPKSPRLVNWSEVVQDLV